jgi:hypothetical protein
MTMLRITVTTGSDETRITLDGRLAGPWVEELARCWTKLRAAPDGRPILVDLEGVLFIGAAGKFLLRAMHEQGATLAATGCMTRAIVNEITASPHEHGRRDPDKKGGHRWST